MVSATFPAFDSLATDCCFLIFANAQILIMKSHTYAVTHSNFDHLLYLDGSIAVSLTIAAFTCTTFFLSSSALAFEGSSDGLTGHDSCGIFNQLGPFHQRLLSTSLRMFWPYVVASPGLVSPGQCHQRLGSHVFVMSDTLFAINGFHGAFGLWIQ